MTNASIVKYHKKFDCYIKCIREKKNKVKIIGIDGKEYIMNYVGEKLYIDGECYTCEKKYIDVVAAIYVSLMCDNYGISKYLFSVQNFDGQEIGGDVFDIKLSESDKIDRANFLLCYINYVKNDMLADSIKETKAFNSIKSIIGGIL